MSQDVWTYDTQYVLGSPHGRRWLKTLLGNLGIDRASYGGDTHATAYNEGRRSVAIDLDRELRLADVRLWAQMHAEHLATVTKPESTVITDDSPES